MIAASVGLRGVLVAAAAVAAAIGDGASAEKLARQRSAPRGELLREASLVAHVRIAQAAELRGGQPHYFAHIIDAAQGPPAGQMVLLAHDEQREGAPLAWKTGERYIVLARRLPGGVYAPLASEASIVSSLSISGKISWSVHREMLQSHAGNSCSTHLENLQFFQRWALRRRAFVDWSHCG